MELNTFEVAVTIVFLCTLGVGVGLFAGLNNSLHDQIEKTREGLGRLGDALGFSYEENWRDGRISFYTEDGADTPASCKHVEKLIDTQNTNLTALYKHLGIKMEKKVTPATDRKEEIVVSKVK